MLLAPLKNAAWAQQEDVKAGDRIRVTYKDITIHRLSGLLQEVSGDSLYLAQPDSIVAFSLSSVRKLEISTGKKRRGLRGMMIGGAGGGLFLGLYFMLADESCDPDDTWCMDLFSPGESFILGLVTGSVLGAVTGGVIGHLTKTDKWKQISIKPVSVGYGQGRAYALTMSVNLFNSR